MVANTPEACTLPQCDRPAKRRQLCYAHYMKQWRHGDPGWTAPKRRRDLTGERFGLLVVLRETDPHHWLCLCDCGNESRVRAWSLTSGGTTTCDAPDAGHRRAEYVSYGAAHRRVATDRGKASSHPCVDCSGTASHWSYDHSDPDEMHTEAGYAYSLDLSRYEPRCVPCHKAFDVGRIDARVAGDDAP